MAIGVITKLARVGEKLINMAGELGAQYVDYLSPLANAVRRSVAAKLQDTVTVKDFGAMGDGIADDRAAMTKMADVMGYIVFPSGHFSIPDNYTFSVPQFYRDGAILDVPAGKTLWVSNRIHSPNQWIFQGAGSVLMYINNTGEDSQDILAGWFGVFPSNTTVTDITARMQRALNSLSTQTREGIVRVGMGSYHISATMTVPRGVHVDGRGTRRTVWDVSGAADFPIFVTGGNACKFSNFQFEYPSAEAKVRTAPYIQVSHNTCEIRDLWLFPSTVGIIIDQPQCVIKNINVTYGLDPKSVGVLDTCLIWARSGAFNIDGVYVNNTSFGPHHIVRVGHNITVGNGQISNIQTTVPANQVFFDGRAGSITRVGVSGVVNNASATTQFDALIKVMAASAFTVGNITLDGLIGNTYADSLVHIEAADTSIISNISIGTASIQGANGAGIKLVNAAGSNVRDIYISEACDVSARTVRLSKTGTIGYVGAPPHVLGAEYRDVHILNHQIADDTAFILDMNRATIFSGILSIGSSSPNVGAVYSFRAAASANHITPLTVPLTNMAAVLTPLTGTTGVDGKFTVGIQEAGKLVFENRTGASVTVTIMVAAGT